MNQKANCKCLSRNVTDCKVEIFASRQSGNFQRLNFHYTCDFTNAEFSCLVTIKFELHKARCKSLNWNVIGYRVEIFGAHQRNSFHLDFHINFHFYFDFMNFKFFRLDALNVGRLKARFMCLRWNVSRCSLALFASWQSSFFISISILSVSLLAEHTQIVINVFDNKL